MVFIGIVTSSMVKNTMSQSEAAAGYGSVRTVQSTAESGLIVTESYLRKTPNAKRVSAVIDSALNNNNPKDTFLVRGSGSGSKTPFANGLMFSSRIVEITGRSNKDVIAGIDVRIGRTANGRDLGRYITYGTFGKYTQDDPAEGNALYVGGTTNVISNVHITIPKGNATFMNDFEIQRHFKALDGDLWVRKDTVRKVSTENASFYAKNGITVKKEPPCCRTHQARVLDVSKLPQTVGVNVFVQNSNITYSTTSNLPGPKQPTRYRFDRNAQINPACLQGVFTQASNDERLYNGFLVVEIDSANNFQFQQNDVFYKNVIFVVHGTFRPNNFYNNFLGADTGNTMIYVAPQNGNLTAGFIDGFKLPQRFNGMIYVDSANARDQRIEAGSTNMIGAMLMTGTGKFELNAGGDVNTLNITYNSAILGSYGIPLINRCPDDCGEAFAKKMFKFETSDSIIEYKPFAHYFY